MNDLEALAHVYFDIIDDEKRIVSECKNRKAQALAALQEKMEEEGVEELSNDNFYAKWTSPADKNVLDTELWENMVDQNILLFGAAELQKAFNAIVNKAKERAMVSEPQQPRFIASRKSKRGK